MFMLGLGPIAVVHNLTDTSFSMQELASDFWCRSIIDRLLYKTTNELTTAVVAGNGRLNQFFFFFVLHFL